MISGLFASAAARNWKLFAGGAVLLALIVALLLTRTTLERTKASLEAEQSAHALTVANYRKAAAEAEASDKANVWRVATDQKEITDAVTEDYQSQLDAVRARYERLRAEASANPGRGANAPVPGVPAAAGGTDAAAAEARLPGPDALIASEQALQLQALQEWARRQAAVEVNGEQPPK